MPEIRSPSCVRLRNVIGAHAVIEAAWAEDLIAMSRLSGALLLIVSAMPQVMR
jgi:hypothetical protein